MGVHGSSGAMGKVSKIVAVVAAVAIGSYCSQCLMSNGYYCHQYSAPSPSCQTLTSVCVVSFGHK